MELNLKNSVNENLCELEKANVRHVPIKNVSSKAKSWVVLELNHPFRLFDNTKLTKECYVIEVKAPALVTALPTPVYSESPPPNTVPSDTEDDTAEGEASAASSSQSVHETLSGARTPSPVNREAGSKPRGDVFHPTLQWNLKPVAWSFTSRWQTVENANVSPWKDADGSSWVWSFQSGFTCPAQFTNLVFLFYQIYI